MIKLKGQNLEKRESKNLAKPAMIMITVVVANIGDSTTENYHGDDSLCPPLLLGTSQAYHLGRDGGGVSMLAVAATHAGGYR